MQQVEFVFAFGKPWLGVCDALASIFLSESDSGSLQ